MHANVQQIGKIDIFSNLESDILSKLASSSILKSYKKGEIIIHEGDPFLAKLYAIVEGNLLIQKVSMSGKETNLRQLPAGEIFAAPALFGDGIAPATVIAVEKSKIVTIDKSELLKAIRLAPEIAFQILHCFNKRLQEMHQTIHGLISERAVVRLVRLIHYTASQHGIKQTEKGACINTKLPHKQMARMVGISYEECVRIISKDLNGIVIYERGGVITIEDALALESLTNYL